MSRRRRIILFAYKCYGSKYAAYLAAEGLYNERNTPVARCQCPRYLAPARRSEPILRVSTFVMISRAAGPVGGREVRHSAYGHSVARSRPIWWLEFIVDSKRIRTGLKQDKLWCISDSRMRARWVAINHGSLEQRGQRLCGSDGRVARRRLASSWTPSTRFLRLDFMKLFSTKHPFVHPPLCPIFQISARCPS
jgi:hypothetical protein